MLFSGRVPIAPGTAGSAVTAVAWFLFGGSLTPAAWVLLLLAVTAVAVVTAGAEARALGRQDPGPVVIDEAAGFLFTVAFLPHGLWTTLAAFVLFRILAGPPAGSPARRLGDRPGRRSRGHHGQPAAARLFCPSVGAAAPVAPPATPPTLKEL